jgi:hypothetical protein
MVDLVYSSRISGYYAEQIAKELNLQNGETKVFPMDVTFRAQNVEGHMVIYYTLKSSAQDKLVNAAPIVMRQEKDYISEALETAAAEKVKQP